MGRYIHKMASKWLLAVFLLHRAAAMNDTTMEPKAGRPGSPNVVCGKWTNRLVNIGDYNEGTFVADKSTKRCVARYQMTTCLQLQITCSHLLVDNRDPDKCKRGNALIIKADDTKPKRFCKKDYLGPVYPARAFRSMKVWYVSTEGILGKGRYKNQGANCTIICATPL